MSEQEYIDYFEYLASQHQAIQHAIDPILKRKAFYYVHEDNMAELETAIKNQLRLPALLLDQYFDESDTENDNNRLRIQGGLSVICKVEAGNLASIRAARQQARLIARSFIKRLRLDCRYGGVLYEKNILVQSSTQGEPTPVIGGGAATGWGYGFTLLMPDREPSSPADWLDS